jgi:hypothetical protein
MLSIRLGQVRLEKWHLYTMSTLVSAGILVLVAVIACVACALKLWSQDRPHVFRGVVCDCETGEVIQGANIELRQQTLLTWTQVHQFNGISDARGRFEIPYDVGNNVHVRTWKEGYLLSDDYSFPGAVRIGLIKEAANEAALWHTGAMRYSQNCKRAFKCHTEALKNGVKVMTDQCGPLPPLISSTPITGKKPGR